MLRATIQASDRLAGEGAENPNLFLTAPVGKGATASILRINMKNKIKIRPVINNSDRSALCRTLPVLEVAAVATFLAKIILRATVVLV